MTLTREHDRRPRRTGAVLVWVALSLTVIVGVVALNLDGGRMMEERRRAQSVADAAALTAGAELYGKWWQYQGADTKGTARGAALQVAAANGYPADAVTVSIPPTTGAYAGQLAHAEVTVSTRVGASFGRMFSGDDPQVSARAVARGEPRKIGIVLLRPTGADAFRNDALAFALVNKPLVVNSNDPAAFRQGVLGVFLASKVEVTGGVANPGGSLLPARTKTGVRPTLDPLAFLPAPSSGGTVRSESPLTINSAVPTVLQPGVYKGGIRVTALATVLMLPGVYVMEGGGFKVDGLATVAGLGVMIYNTTSPTYPAGPFSVTGLGKVVMTAPLSGTYQGVSLFQHRGLAQPISVTGVGVTTIGGAVYAPKAPVTLTGTAAVGLDILGGAYVVDSMTVGGVGAVTIDLGLNPPRVPDVKLVE